MSLPPLTRPHLRRLREIHRSAGWPSHDMLEVELLAAGLLERQGQGAGGVETLRLTDEGIRQLAQGFARNKAARTPHEALVEQVALAQVRAGRLAWRGLALRVQVPQATGLAAESAPPGPTAQLSMPGWSPPEPLAVPDAQQAWCVACPDVFSIRHSSVEAYLEPVVHEIKVSRADLLGDLKKPAKRAAYLGLSSACWYVLGQDARGRPIGSADDVPPECGVMLATAQGLVVAREAPRRALERLPFHVWMALAKAGPALREEDPAQASL